MSMYRGRTVSDPVRPSKRGTPSPKLDSHLEHNGRLVRIQACTGDADTASAGAGPPGQISVSAKGPSRSPPSAPSTCAPRNLKDPRGAR